MPIVGAHGRGGHKEPAGRARALRLRDAARRKRWPRRSSDSRWRATTRRCIVRDGKRLRAIPANRKVDERDAAAQSDAPSRKSGWIDLDRIRAAGRPARASGGRCCARCGGCSATSSGRRRCRASTGTRCTTSTRRCSTRVELARRAVRPHLGDAGRARHVACLRNGRRPPQAAGSGRSASSARELQARRRTARATRSRASSQGDPWDAGADSPLNAIGVEAKVGERIVAVNGQRVSQSSCRRRRCSCTRPTPRSSSRIAGDQGDAHGGRRRRSPTKCPRAIANGSSATAHGCTRSPTAASATSTCPT